MGNGTWKMEIRRCWGAFAIYYFPFSIQAGILQRPEMPCSSVSTVRVRYAETDKMGVVYYANYFVWFEVGRTDLLRNMGWSYREMEQAGVSLPVIEAHCDYHRPARYDDELDVQTEGRLLSPVRVEFTYQIVRREGQVLAASGRTVHAALDPSGKPCRLPERVRQVFA
jgi:acyl-CoA thioester hydrolase